MTFNKEKFKSSYTFEFIQIITSKRLFVRNIVVKLHNEPTLLDFVIYPFQWIWNIIKLFISLVLSIISFPIGFLKSVEFKDIGGIKTKKKDYYDWLLDLEKVDFFIWKYYTDDHDITGVYYKKGGTVTWSKDDIVRSFVEYREKKDYKEDVIKLAEKLITNFETKEFLRDYDFKYYMFFKGYLEYLRAKE